MGKNNKKKLQVPHESHLLLPAHPSCSGSEQIVDTHTHLVSTFSSYQSKYREGRYGSIFDFVKGIYTQSRHKVEAIVDVWCEAPVQKVWKELADSALTAEGRRDNWGGIEYWFVMGMSLHEAKLYTDDVEKDILDAMTHPRCVGWGEIGLDYHYDNSPREIQQDVLRRQLRHAVRLGKPLTIHTREAEGDTERILKEEVPKDYRIHIHCFTDSPEFAQRLLDHFPNLYIGITGVITYSTNLNTSAVIRHLSSTPPLRILLETDAPFMIPANLYSSLPALKGKLPLCHTAMIPWTAEFVAGVVGEGWDTEKVMKEANENAKKMYGV
ncbi:Metallo-dependent hydrolase [Gloeophyllum trabeum ATCC 11539]|uniref:Metallo-dependent hydrolase n=1 Tax=Gloeophyllum trabeum (strain ATCC 11539 / FP-39264 / Madison 617) TaxID=670483 RepID=S7RJW5_GLOTA|nr:Metallo-dependent hydrolase [Gloeophyllum trabeum ATCC 11539]EPQ52929.1 Metallo-dependent hydrolase [Gloeophyllum trabeum ATCC 11539]